MRSFADWVGASEETPEIRSALLRARWAAFSTQIPLLYAILAIDAATISFTHYGRAPFGWAVVMPAVLIVWCVIRMSIWIARRKKTVSVPTGELRLSRTIPISVLLAALFVGWVLILYSWGDAAMRAQLVGTFGITALCCIFCVLQLRVTALVLAASVPVVAAYVVLTGERTLAAFAVDLVLVTFGMMYLLLASSRDFRRMIVAQEKAQRLSEINAHLAHVDSLTELPNRRQYFEKLEQAVARGPDAGRFHVGIVDLDGFKPVNDVFGHIVGDRVLVDCAHRLRAVAADRFFVARLGGDEFGLIIENMPDDAAALDLAREICVAVREPFAFDDAIASIAASIGLAAFPEAGDTPRKLYERADYALYFAKQGRRGQPVLFDLEHEQRMKGAATIEQTLRRADLERELSLSFQPLFRASTGAIEGFEALARWESPELGNVAPDKFIEIAERSDMIYAITRVLLRKALHAAALWPAHIGLSFNLSARDIISPLAVSQIVALIESSGVDPRRIDLEVTETALMTDFDRARESLLTLKRAGVRIALDDFGSGYSSLNYVHRLPLDRIKIDRGFVQEMETSSVALDIVRTLVDMCRNMRLQCVIEGVEKEAQLAVLTGFGDNLLQGYFLGRPMPEPELADFIARNPDTPSRKAV